MPTITISRIRGRNGWSSPLDLPADIATEALNVEFFQSSLANKRPGLASETIGSVFTAPIGALYRHVPSNDQTAAELWGVGGTVVGRMAAASTFSAVTLLDAAQGNAWDHRFASFNGKLFHAYNTAVDRLHCWDGTSHRRVGLATPSAPTVADTGAGSYAAVLRYYRVRDVILSGSTIVARSEPSASVSFTPSGSGTAARVTYVTTDSDAAATHWEVEASTDNVTFYRLARTAEATTTYDDSAATTSYDDNTASAIGGAYEAPKSWRYLMVLDNYLLGAGNWESGPNSRVYWTALLNSSGEGDDERVPNTTDHRNYLDLSEGAGGAIVGFGGPLFGNALVYMERAVWKLVPTGSLVPAFRRFIETDKVGLVRQEARALGVDEDGDPCEYALDPTLGPYRIGKRGFQWIGRDVFDIWSTFSPGAAQVAAWMIYFPAKLQIICGVATGTGDPDQALVFDTRLGRLVEEENGEKVFTGGWSVWSGGEFGNLRAAAVFASSRGATMGLALVPYYTAGDTNNILFRGDTGTDDAGTAFQAYVTTRPLPVADGAHKAGLKGGILMGEASSGVTITVTMNRDFGRQTRSATATLTALGSEARVEKYIEDLDLTDARFVAFQIGDGAAASNDWNLDRLIVFTTQPQQKEGHS